MYTGKNKMENCEYLEETKNDSEYMGRPVSELIYTCSLDCDWPCSECDGQGHNKNWGENDEE